METSDKRNVKLENIDNTHYIVIFKNGIILKVLADGHNFETNHYIPNNQEKEKSLYKFSALDEENDPWISALAFSDDVIFIGRDDSVQIVKP